MYVFHKRDAGTPTAVETDAPSARDNADGIEVIVSHRRLPIASLLSDKQVRTWNTRTAGRRN